MRINGGAARQVKMLFVLMASGVLCYIVFTGYARWLTGADALAVREVLLKGNDLLSDGEVREAAGLVSPEHMHTVSLSAIDARLRQIPFVESVQVTKSYPGSIQLRIEEKQPIALLKVDGELYCLDETGLVLPSRPGKMYNLPLLSGDYHGGTRTGATIGNRRIRQSLDLLRSVIAVKPELYSRISEIVTGTADSLLVYTVRGAIPVKFGTDNLEYKIHCLDAVLDKMDQEQLYGEVRYIDLRYASQVVLGMRI
ncbi:FtsQ-type POTRA domain-containing protein [bacterium]|nr:FtsQ-type POTRA domain-containing protein [bacterium]